MIEAHAQAEGVVEGGDSLSHFENSLRPTGFGDYTGQGDICRNLDIAIRAAVKRDEPLDHILLSGPPGLGKTSLAYIIAREAGAALQITSGPALEKQGDIASILSNLKARDVLFIDEIHRLKPAIEEMLYTAMEDFRIDIVIGKGPSARIMRLSLPQFTLIGATTRVSMISAPLRDRFVTQHAFEFYSEEELMRIILRSAHLLNVQIDEDAAHMIARCSRGTPRISNRLLKRVRDFAEVHEGGTIGLKLATRALSSLGIDDRGLDPMDRRLLLVLIEKFSGGPVGLNTLSAALSEEQDTVESIYEPFLIQLGFLERTARGRLATPHAYVHLGLPFMH